MESDENIFIHLGIVFFYFIILLVGFIGAYIFNVDPLYYATRTFIYNPVKPSKSRVFTVISICSRFINGPTMMATTEIMQSLGQMWLFIPMLLPFATLIGLVLFTFLLKHFEYDSLDMLFHKSAGPFAFIFYLIIVISKIFLLAASFSVLQSFLSDSNIVNKDFCVWIIGLISVTYAIFGGLNLISWSDVLTACIYVALLIILLIMLLASPYSQDTVILNLRENHPVDNVAASVDYSFMVILGGFLDPLLIYSNMIYSEGHKITFVFIGPVVCVILLAFFSINIMVTIIALRMDNSTFYHDTSQTYSFVFLMLHRSNHGLIQFIILGLLGACHLVTHNQMLIDTTYLLCTNTLRLTTFKHFNKELKLLLHQFCTIIISIIAIRINLLYFPDFTCLILSGLDILYTIVFPQFVASFLSTNFTGAIVSLLISILLRLLCLDLMTCTIVDILLTSKFNAIKFFLPLNKVNFLPVRTIIVLLSIVINVCVSQIAKRIFQKYISLDFLENLTSTFYLVDDQITCDNSSASVRIKWDLTTVQSIEQTMPFGLTMIPKAELYYKVIPEDLANRLGPYSKKTQMTHVNKIFKIPLQNRLYRKELTVEERRERLMLNKAMMEWTYYCYMKGIHYNGPEQSELIESFVTLSDKESIVSPVRDLESIHNKTSMLAINASNNENDDDTSSESIP